MTVKMHHTGVVVRDLEKAIAFYRDVVGLELQTKYERTGPPVSQVVGYEHTHVKIAFLGAAGGHAFELIQYVNPPSDERPTEERNVLGGSHLAFLVDDIDEAFRTLADSGAVVMNPPAELVPGRKACYLQDPDRNWIELLELSG